MKNRIVGVGIAAGALVALAGTAFGDGFVVRTDFDVDAAWLPKTHMGKTFFPLLNHAYWTGGGAPEGFDVYRDCGLRIYCQPPPGVNELVPAKNADGGVPQKGYASVTTNRISRSYSLRESVARRYGKKTADGLYGDAFDNRPIQIEYSGARPSFYLNGSYPYADRADFADWRAKHPNFLGFCGLYEYDSDCGFYYTRFPDTTDERAFARLQSAFPCTFRDYAMNVNFMDEWIAKSYRRLAECHFGCTETWSMPSGTPGLLPLFAKAGAKGLTYEATTQGMENHWSIGGCYLRGAARAYGLPYGWYTANFYEGYERGSDKPVAGENSFLLGKNRNYPFFGLHRGASMAIIMRQNLYGWLIGSLYVHPENWSTYHRREVEKDKFVPGPGAVDFQRLYDLSKRVDRGVAYTPLALLMPIHEKVAVSGLQLNYTSYRQTAVFATLVPRSPAEHPRKAGLEGGFYNSEFGETWDVVCPDATNDAAVVARMLRPYKAAVLVGRYRPVFGTKEEVNPESLARYVREGGTLVISEDQIRKSPKYGAVEPSLAGVTFPNRRRTISGAFFTDDRGVRVPLGQTYVICDGVPTTARPFWRDEKGAVLAWANDVGRGRVVTVAVAGLMPEGLDQTPGIQDCRLSNEMTDRMMRGEIPFDLHKAIFRRIQEETMPVKVTGNCQWGVNKVERRGGEKKVKVKGEGEQRMADSSSGGALGDCALPDDGRGRSPNGPQSNNQTIQQSNNSHRWLVWIFNNDGVTNFIGEAPIFDESKASDVTIDFKGMKPRKVYDADTGKAIDFGESCTVRVGPGDWRLVMIEK